MDAWSPPRSIQIGAGLGAGDVGDELLCRGFWDALPAAARLDVDLGGDAVPSEPYDERHVYRTADPSRPHLPGLLVGTSARAETMGVDAFLCSLARRLDAFHDAGRPVDAVGVGFERPRSPEAQEAFRRSFLPIRSWSVVSPHARDVLRELGVPEPRIVVGADWGWSYRLRSHPQAWAQSLWRDLGVDPGAPLVVVDVSVPALAADAPALAEALDRLATERGFQVAFFDSDTSGRGEPDAAQRTMAHMKARAVRVPRAVYAPDQVLALLECATTVVSSRRQLVVQALCARTHAIVLAHGEGLAALCAELRVDPVPARGLEPERLLAAVPQRDLRLSAERLQDARRRMEARSANNLALWAEASGFGGDPRPLAATIERMSATTWYHRIEIAPGVVTPGQRWEMMWGPIRRRHEEADFRGKSVLEVGCWDGYWSFEAERLGAAEILATDDLSQRRLPTRNVLFAAECLRSRVRYLDDVSVYELPERLQRTFDVVIFYGVLYHLRYPVLALAKLRRVVKPGGVLLVETAVLPDEEEPVMRWGYRSVYPEDASTWNAMSLRCLRDMLETSYFEVELCETYMRHAGFGRGYARARAVLRLDPDPHPVPDHFLKDLPTGDEGGGKGGGPER